MEIKKSKPQSWTEEETLLALYLYFQLPFGKLHSGNPEIQQLAKAIGRSSNSVAMKLCNFASLDPKITGTGRKGLAGASKLDRETYSKFGNDWDGLVRRSEGLWRQYIFDDAQESSDRVAEAPVEFRFEPFLGNSTTRATVNRRGGQGFFRRAVLANYSETCCITGLSDPRLLIASHISEWSKDALNRHNPANGLLLSATFDRAFECGLIAVDRKCVIHVSRQLLDSDNPANRNVFAPYQNCSLRAAVRFDPDPSLLEWHFANRFVDSMAA